MYPSTQRPLTLLLLHFCVLAQGPIALSTCTRMRASTLETLDLINRVICLHCLNPVHQALPVGAGCLQLHAGGPQGRAADGSVDGGGEL